MHYIPSHITAWLSCCLTVFNWKRVSVNFLPSSWSPLIIECADVKWNLSKNYTLYTQYHHDHYPSLSVSVSLLHSAFSLCFFFTHTHTQIRHVFQAIFSHQARMNMRQVIHYKNLIGSVVANSTAPFNIIHHTYSLTRSHTHSNKQTHTHTPQSCPAQPLS